MILNGFMLIDFIGDMVYALLIECLHVIECFHDTEWFYVIDLIIIELRMRDY